MIPEPTDEDFERDLEYDLEQIHTSPNVIAIGVMAHHAWPAAIRRALAAERAHAKLQAFKSWCHDYLDRQGVPHHPPGVHGAEGCRIGDRLDWLMDRLHTVEAEKERLAGIMEAPQVALFANGREPTENEQSLAKRACEEIARVTCEGKPTITLFQCEAQALLNLLSRRQQEAADAKAERDACHALFDEVIILCGHDPASGHPGVVNAVRQVVGDRDQAIAVACERVGADPEVRRVLLDEIGTTEADLLADELRQRREQQEASRRLLQSVRALLWDAESNAGQCYPPHLAASPWPELRELAARVHAFLGE